MGDVVGADGVAGPTQQPRKRRKLSPSTTSVELTDGKPSTDERIQLYEATVDDLRETEVGIRCYVNTSHSGFSGIFKQRFTDFCVNEIDLNGNVVHLTSLGVLGAEPERVSPQKSPEALGDIGITSMAKTGATIADTPVSGTANSGQLTSIETPDEITRLPGVPTEAVHKADATSMDETATSRIVSKPIIRPEDTSLLDSYFGILVRQSIVGLYEKVLLDPQADASSFGVVMSQPITSDAQRATIHQKIHRIFLGVLQSSSEPEDVIAISAACHKQKTPRGRSWPQGKTAWQKLGGEFLHFSLYKANKDTMEVLNFLSSRLKIPAVQFKTAGTKDRRAVTVQRASVRRVRAEAIASLNSVLINSRVGDFSYHRENLALGDLAGNEFQITLRRCVFRDIANDNMPEEDQLDFATTAMGAAIANLQRDGFINYYGLQRFGTHGVGTQEVGKLILKGDYKGAVDAILAFPSEALVASSDPEHANNDILIPRDDIARALAINTFRTTSKFTEALETLPRRFVAERHLMIHLQEKWGKDFVGALTRIPRNLKTMYIHAYQSLVWNMVASKRWDQYGARVVKGDLIIIKSPKNKPSSATNLVDEDGEMVLLPDVSDRAVTSNDLFERARSLTEKEAASGKYNIFDIVLPTPGYDINYPDNDIGDYYKEFMGSEMGGGLDPANMRRPQRDFSLSGSYRKLMGSIGNDVSFQVKLYTDENEQFVQTDLEKLEMRLKSNRKIDKDQNAGDGGADGDIKPPLTDNITTNANLKKLAVILKFQLSSSVYATMALRELMKRGGARAFQPEFSFNR